MPPIDVIWDRFTYDPLTGILRYRIKHYGKDPGSIAGNLNKRLNRWVVPLNGQQYLRSRIVMAWLTGKDPGDLIVDHINHDSLCDAFYNLRLVDRSCNNHHRQHRGSIRQRTANSFQVRVKRNDVTLTKSAPTHKQALEVLQELETELYPELNYG